MPVNVHFLFYLLDISTSGLAAAMLDFKLPMWYDSIVSSSIGLLYPENIGIAVEITFLSCLQTFGALNSV